MNHNNETAAQTALEALQEARATKTIHITDRTIDILERVASLNRAADDLIDVFDLISTPEESDRITGEFYDKYTPTINTAYAEAGKAILNEVFSTLKFNGL